MGLPMKMSRKPQLLQNGAVLSADGPRKLHHITPIMRDLHGLPIFCAQFKALVLNYKVLYGQGPKYLKDHLHLKQPAGPIEVI